MSPDYHRTTCCLEKCGNSLRHGVSAWGYLVSGSRHRCAFLPSWRPQLTTALPARCITSLEGRLWAYQMFGLFLVPRDPTLGSEYISRLFPWFVGALEGVFCLFALEYRAHLGYPLNIHK